MFYEEIKKKITKCEQKKKYLCYLKKKDTIPIPNAVLCKLCCV